jgi:hypothetical protein
MLPNWELLIPRAIIDIEKLGLLNIWEEESSNDQVGKSPSVSSNDEKC